MPRTLYDPSNNPEEIDGMETFHPYPHASSHVQEQHNNSSVMMDEVGTQLGSIGGTDRTLVERKSRTRIGEAFEGGRVGGPAVAGATGGGGLGTGKVFSPPHSAYPLSAAPSSTMHYGSDPTGTIGVHHPKEVVRIERDWTGPAGGGVVQFQTGWVMELEGRVTPTQFQALINTINQHLQSAQSTSSMVWENTLAVLTWFTSLSWYTPRYEKELREMEKSIDKANVELWNSKGLNVLSPRDVALQYLEIEYY